MQHPLPLPSSEAAGSAPTGYFPQPDACLSLQYWSTVKPTWQAKQMVTGKVQHFWILGHPTNAGFPLHTVSIVLPVWHAKHGAIGILQQSSRFATGTTGPGPTGVGTPGCLEQLSVLGFFLQKLATVTPSLQARHEADMAIQHTRYPTLGVGCGLGRVGLGLGQPSVFGLNLQ